MGYVSKSNSIKGVITVFSIFILILYLNYCTPLIFDDYIYSFVFSEDSMGIPLSDTTKRIGSFNDLLISQWCHYFSWGGRTVAHTLAQFFLWQGKPIFNFFNSICFIVLILEINWIINKGIVNCFFKAKDVLLVFGLLWLFSFNLGDVFVWLTLSCNYLWTTVLLLALLIVYEHKYLFPERKNLFLKNKFILFLFGFIVGWTNENTVLFAIFIMICFMLYLRKTGKTYFDSEVLLGLSGMVLGFLLLMLAPGNYVRYMRNLHDGMLLTGVSLIKKNWSTLAEIFAGRFILFYYVFKKLLTFRKSLVIDDNKKEYIVAAVFCFLSIGSLVIMLFSPEFRFRSSFPSLVFLIIAAGIVRKIGSSENKNLTINKNEKKIYRFVRFAGTIYVCTTILFSLYVYTLQHWQTEMMLSAIEKERCNPQKQTLVIKERPYALKDYSFYNAVTGGHLVFPYSVSSNEESWINRDVAFYYGIKAIKTEKDEDLQ